MKEPRFEKIDGRVAVLGWVYQTLTGPKRFVHQMLRFSGVRAGRWTIESACTLSMVTTSNGRLVDLGETDWLSETGNNIANYTKNSPPILRHLRIFIDGPGCFEFICESFEAAEAEAEADGPGQ